MCAQIYDFIDNTGGMNLRSIEQSANSGTQQTEQQIICNMDLFRSGGYRVQPGNYVLNSGITDTSEVVYFTHWKNRFYYVKQSKNVYSITISGGIEQLEGTLPSVDTPIDSSVFKGDKIVFVSKSFQPHVLDNAGLRLLTGTFPSDWLVNPPYLSIVKDGTILILISKTGIWGSALLDETDFTTPNDSFVISGFFGNNSEIVSVDNFGSDIIISTQSQSMARLTGQTIDEYRVIPISTNTSAVNNNSAVQFNQALYFHNGEGIYALNTTDFNTIKLGQEPELSYMIKPLFTSSEPEMPIPKKITKKTQGFVGSSVKNNYLCYYYSDDDSGYVNRAMFFDFNMKAWIWRNTTLSSYVYCFNEDSQEKKIILCTPDGKILADCSGSNSFVNISSELAPVPYIRNHFFGGSSSKAGGSDIIREKEFIGISFWFRVLGSARIRLRIFKDYERTHSAEEILNISGTISALTYGVSQYGVSLVDETISQYRRFSSPIVARVLAYEIAILDAPVGFKLSSYHIEVEQGQNET